ncbi:hypothetical protein DRO97_02500 [Archaeoglobales archaeon]|nr:MAG: hypothetical protein DRO97_02500 [Archaeoglobales archaeon]
MKIKNLVKGKAVIEDREQKKEDNNLKKVYDEMIERYKRGQVIDAAILADAILTQIEHGDEKIDSDMNYGVIVQLAKFYRGGYVI